MAESEIEKTEQALQKSKELLASCRNDVAKAIAIAEEAAIQANIASNKATALAAATAAVSSSQSSIGVNTMNVTDTIELKTDEVLDSLDQIDLDSLTYNDVDYHLSEMAPPFINEDQCLVPGEAVVRVEKAAGNSRRIFAGIDIMASVDDVWNILTNYDKLHEVIPNLVRSEVVELYDAKEDGLNYEVHPDVSKEEELNAIEEISRKLKGSRLKQVGGSKVVGINFSARVTVEVREWPNGIPFVDETTGYDGSTERRRQLERYRFPRPFAISRLPTKDISMQSVADDDGDFRLYQGVWRMQPLPGCAPEGGAAMRLTYAVEVSPRPYLPVALVEGRLSQELCNNLLAIRDLVTQDESVPSKA